jgi:hypothetical protein
MSKKTKTKKNKSVMIAKEDAVKVVADFAASGSAVIMIDENGDSINAGIPMKATERQKLLFSLGMQHLRFLSYAPTSTLKDLLDEANARLDRMGSDSCGDPDCHDCVDRAKGASDKKDDDDDDDGLDILFEPSVELDPIKRRISRKKMQ